MISTDYRKKAWNMLRKRKKTANKNIQFIKIFKNNWERHFEELLEDQPLNHEEDELEHHETRVTTNGK